MSTCTSCGKGVCHSSPEEVIAVNRTWHKTCFVCGGTGNQGCKRQLSLLAYVYLYAYVAFLYTFNFNFCACLTYTCVYT